MQLLRSGGYGGWLDWFEVAIEIDKEEVNEANVLIMKLEGPAYDMWRGLPAEQ